MMSSIPIVRRYQTTDQTAPWEGIVFTHEVGTDDLSEALKVSFSRYRTLRERKCAAVIAFFEQELHDMQLSNNTTTPAKTPPSQGCHQPEARFDTQGGDCSEDYRLPPVSPASSINSSVFRDPDGQYSTVQHAPSLSLPADPTLATTSTRLVFSAFDGRPMHQKTKRKMTSEEKQEYKKTRQRGACHKCKRTKAKCTHMESHHSSLEDTTGLTERSQRGISLKTEMIDVKHPKAIRLEYAPDPYRHNPDTIHQRTFSSHFPSRRASNASEQSFAVQNDSRAPVETSDQHDTSGYVNQSSSSAQHNGSLPNDQPSLYWPNYNQPETVQLDPMDSFPSGFDGHGRHTFPSSPIICVQGPGQEDVFPFAYSSLNQWDQDYSQGNGMT